MYRIGLTGGVGSGKSTVSSYLKELRYPVIDGDQLAREAVMIGSEAVEELRHAFGNDIFFADGTLDRKKMGEMVFSCEEKRRVLNGILHPYIWRRTAVLLSALQEEGHEVVVLDMPLLLEIGWQLRVEEIWIVRVPVDVQISRVIERDGFTKEEVMQRINKQMAAEQKVKYADVVIDNSGTLEETKEQVREALKRISLKQGGSGL